MPRLLLRVMPGHTCPFGLKALHLLAIRGYQVEDRHLATRAEVDAFKARHHVATLRAPEMAMVLPVQHGIRREVEVPPPRA